MDTAEHIDEFESLFRKSEREHFVYKDQRLSSISLVTDQSAASGEDWKEDVKSFLSATARELHWTTLDQNSYSNVQDLLQKISNSRENIIVTWRNLGEEQLLPQHSLGVYVDVLTQVTDCPVLLLPGSAANPTPLNKQGCKNIMVATDHLAGDHRLVNMAIRVADSDAQIRLCHVEDDRVFERYVDAISKIPAINTDEARTTILEQLQKDAREYIDSVIEQTKASHPQLSVEGVVTQGHRVQAYKQLVELHNPDLLILNTNDGDQLAMHGIAYSLSIEIQNVPLLLL